MPNGASEHTVKGFDIALRDLARMAAEMGGYAEMLTTEAVNALVTHDRERGRKVILADALIDNAQRAIEEKAIATIATRQPMAVDLREIVGVLRIASNLERIGDLAKNIGKRALVVDAESVPRQALRGMVSLSDLAAQLLRDVLDSYAERNTKKALDVWKSDEKVDAMYFALTCELLTYATENPRLVAPGVHLLFCAKNLERIGDHATNIAESVQYIVQGQGFTDERPKAETTRFAELSFNTNY